MLLRVLTGAALIHFGITGILEGTPPLIIALQVIGATTAIFLLLGLFTPLAGAVAAIAKTGMAVARLASYCSGDPWITIAEAVLAASLAMIGPGAWSIDARLFGRKHIDLSDR
jgi:uncharacterized membrane protein YphA (DoxX/SURF4 family)